MSIHQIRCSYTFLEVSRLKEYWEVLRDLREDHDLRQEDVALLGTTQQVYSRYEKGINELPIRHLVALCRFYGVSADYILGLSGR